MGAYHVKSRPSELSQRVQAPVDKHGELSLSPTWMWKSGTGSCKPSSDMHPHALSPLTLSLYLSISHTQTRKVNEMQ